MGRKKLAIPSERMYFNGLLRPGEDDDLIEWYKSLPTGQKFQSLCAVLRSGGGLQTKTEADGEKAAQSMDDILSSMVK
ncbi:MAG: hypothetical protein HN390_01520 [Anaerolineae bacterium]|jgi:hypothetical protein|nr:hypothetical protein [Anaerolineae bacterium]MBT7192134.1 hypothetical protein [Anaerolineae bacterium]